MKSTSWLRAHIHAFEYFGGVTEVLVPDNLKTGVTKPRRGDPMINEAYRELADYYRAVVVPSRVRKPKDKASVEGTVGYISRQIIASLRNYQCFHLEDLNARIFEKLEEINTMNFQKREGSRFKVFEEEEKSHLHPLPLTRFKMTEWATAKVQPNYHVQVDYKFYSVPYEYVREDVDVRITADVIELYFKDVRIASHPRKQKSEHPYATNPDHMPDHHRLYLDHNPENNRKWAKTIGPHMERLVEHILKTNVEKKALNILNGLRSTASKRTDMELEEATKTLLEISSHPTVAVLKSILERQKKKQADKQLALEPQIEDYGFTRGATYFGRDKK